MASELGASNGQIPSVDTSALVFECLQIEQAHQQWLQALDAVPDPILLHDRAGRILRANRAYADQAQADFDELLGRPYWEWFPQQDGPLPESEAVTDDVGFRSREISLGTGEAYRVLAYGVAERNSERRFGFLIFRDASEQVRREKSEAFFASLAQTAQDPVLVMDDEGRLAYWNEAAERAFGYSSEEALGQPLHDLLAAPGYRDRYEPGLAHFRATGEGPVVGRTLELEARRKDGSIFPIELSVSAIPLDGGWHALGIMRDITERKTGEQRLERMAGFLRALLQANSALVQADDEATLFQKVCEALTENQGYPLAWVGLAENGPGHPVRIAGAAGERIDYLDDIRVTWGDDPLGQGPTGRAIRTATTQRATDLGQDPDYAPWREPARAQGFAASVAVPIGVEAPTQGALNVYSLSAEAFDSEERELLEGLAANTAYGVQALRTQAERDEAQRSLRRALFGTVEVISRTVEMRDPYTAGHQKRVAELGYAIGQRLGLDEDRLQGLYIAGLIHDVGKIAIPAELLSLPGQLSDNQFELIKDHAREGYKIIKDVDFPWPVKNAVLQHHERLDGSGYPDGLSGNAIILEARILGVADMVEAISSHRPYRPALGTDKALAILREERGSRLPCEVVDACVALFTEEGFQWNGDEHSV